MRKFPFLIAWVLAFTIAACSTAVVPETGTERYVVADATFKALLGTVKEAVLAGRVKRDAVPHLKTLLAAAKTALDVWAMAPEDLNAEITTLLALQAARALLLSIEAGTSASYHPIEYGVAA